MKIFDTLISTALLQNAACTFGKMLGFFLKERANTAGTNLKYQGLIQTHKLRAVCVSCVTKTQLDLF